VHKDLKEGFAAHERGDYKTALEIFHRVAKQGESEAQYRLALLYADGEGVSRDYKEAAHWYRLAAQRGHPLAQYNLGLLYANGQGVSLDPKLAVQWHHLAAERGDVRAQYALGRSYAEGQGVPKNFGEAIRWWRLASEQGDEAAKRSLPMLLGQLGPEASAGIKRASLFRKYWFFALQSFFAVGAALIFLELLSFSILTGLPEALIIGALMMHLASEKILGNRLSSGDKAQDYFLSYALLFFLFGGQTQKLFPLKQSLPVFATAFIALTALVAYQMLFFRRQVGEAKEARRILLWGLAAVASFVIVLFAVWVGSNTA